MDHPLVELQMKEVIASLDVAPQTNWKALFNLGALVETRAARYRLMSNIAFSWFAQFSGNK